MFEYSTIFNQNIGSWTISNISDMSFMFYQSTAFNNGDDGNTHTYPLWNIPTNTASISNLNSIFSGASKFNQPIDNWNVSNVTDMGSMFSRASNFNQPIEKWIVSNVVNMSSMFSYAYLFDQSIGSWNVANVIDMNNMFFMAFKFNNGGNTSLWNTNPPGFREGGCINMFNYATSFNQDISSWNLNGITSLSGMFNNASSFNQDISKWVVPNVTDMSFTFCNAKNFTYTVESWDVSNVNDMSYMFDYSGISTNTFNNILNGWHVQQLQPNVILTALGITHTTSAFDSMVAKYKWNIYDNTNSYLIKYDIYNIYVTDQLNYPIFNGIVFVNPNKSIIVQFKVNNINICSENSFNIYNSTNFELILNYDPINDKPNTIIMTYQNYSNNSTGILNFNNSIINYKATISPYIDPICFNKNTKILCIENNEEKYIPIEKMNIYTIVKTYLHGNKRIKNIYRGEMINDPNSWNNCMYKMKKQNFSFTREIYNKNKFAITKTETNEMIDDLIVTGGHSILVDNISKEEEMIQDKYWNSKKYKIDDKKLLLASVSNKFEKIQDNNIYTYYHFNLINDGERRRYGIWANGVLTETMFS